tara:strand:+ start:249 stop:356 length:108 start_codon:yes stop_codon:yes gene_type:complete
VDKPNLKLAEEERDLIEIRLDVNKISSREKQGRKK